MSEDFQIYIFNTLSLVIKSVLIKSSQEYLSFALQISLLKAFIKPKSKQQRLETIYFQRVILV